MLSDRLLALWEGNSANIIVLDCDAVCVYCSVAVAGKIDRQHDTKLVNQIAKRDDDYHDDACRGENAESTMQANGMAKSEVK